MKSASLNQYLWEREAGASKRVETRLYRACECEPASFKATHTWVQEDGVNLSAQTAVAVRRPGGGRNCIIWCPACRSPKPAMVWTGKSVAQDSCPKWITGQCMTVKGHLDTHRHMTTLTHTLYTQVHEWRRLVSSALFTPTRSLNSFPAERG